MLCADCIAKFVVGSVVVSDCCCRWQMEQPYGRESLPYGYPFR